MTVNQLYKAVKDRLEADGIDSPAFEARVLLCDTLGFSDSDLFIRCNDEVDGDISVKLSELCRKRACGEPLQYLIGRWDFMGRSFEVGEGVLIPRPETELLCEKAVQALKNKKNAVVYDLCSGSGCIGITLKKECPDIDVFLVEKSERALFYLMKNASKHLKDTFYTIIRGDVLNVSSFEAYPDADLIISNPPYIRSDEVSLLQKEVTFEPQMALDGGEDGLDFYRVIISKWSKKLKADGEFFFEIGEDQGEAVSGMLDKIGFDSRVIKDYNNLDRIVKGRKKPYNDI